MRVSSTVLVAIVATLHAASAAISDPAIVQQGAATSPRETLHGGRKLLRNPVQDEEERGFRDWFGPKLSGGAEKLSKKEVKAMIQNLVNNPENFNNLVMADANQLAATYASWKGLGVKPKYLTKSMKNAGFGGSEYERFVEAYVTFLNSGIRLQ